MFVLVCRMCVGGTEGQSSANVWKGALAWREAAECRDLYLSLERPPAPGRRDGCRGRSGEEVENVGGELGRDGLICNAHDTTPSRHNIWEMVDPGAHCGFPISCFENRKGSH